jgi:tripartite-type tricarboxylate transporter receptor subunit TctC
MRAYSRIAACALVSLALAAPAAAQKWPSKPIVIITTGSADAAPRIVGDEIARTSNERFVMEARPGASGTIAAEYTLREPADGYVFLNATSALMAAPNTFEVTYDVLRDFTPVSLLATSPFILVAHPSLPVRSLDELVALAKRRPGELSYSSTSPGSSSSITAAAFKAAAHVDILHVSYKTMASALTDVIAGQVQLCMSVGPNAVAQIAAGKVRALAASTPKRSAVVPEVPTFTELGYPEVDVTAWYGILARTGTPPEIVSQLSKEIVTALHKPELRKKYLQVALEPVGNTPEQFRDFMKADLMRWQRAAKAAGLEKKKPQP